MTRTQPHYKQYLPQELLDRLKAESLRTSTPMQVIVRRLLEQALPAQKDRHE